MSCDIRIYESIDKSDSKLRLTAFVGENFGHCIQFTINGYYCQLDQAMLDDLIQTITLRLQLAEGYTATGIERENLIF